MLAASRHFREDDMATDGTDASSIERHALAATLDNFTVGVIIVTHGNRILYANRAATRMFAGGRPIRAVNGRLSTRDPAATDQLGKAIANVLQRHSGLGTAGSGVPLGSPLDGFAIAHVIPLARAELTRETVSEFTAAVLVTRAADRPAVDVAPVADCLGLTPSEARLVEKLMIGATLAEAAAALGIAGTTARTHLTHVFSKVGVSRQVDLVALIHHLVPPVQKPAVN